MRKEEQLVRNYYKARKEINDEINYLQKHSPRYKQKKSLIIFSLVFFTLSMILLIIALTQHLAQPDIIQITENSIYPKEVINTIVKETKVVHLEPEYVDKCVKVKGDSDKYIIRCFNETN